MFTEQQERIITYFNENHPRELERARRLFFEQTREVFEDDPLFDLRISQYFEFFLFHWNFQQMGLTPARLYYRLHSTAMDEQTHEIFKAFCEPVYGVFLIKKLHPKKQLCTLKEMLTGKTYEIFEDRSMAGLEKGSIFQCHLLSENGHFRFCKGIVHHPEEAKAFLRKLPKMVRGDERNNWGKILLALHTMWTTIQLYNSRSIDHIYNEEFLEKYQASDIPFLF